MKEGERIFTTAVPTFLFFFLLLKTTAIPQDISLCLLDNILQTNKTTQLSLKSDATNHSDEQGTCIKQIIKHRLKNKKPNHLVQRPAAAKPLLATIETMAGSRSAPAKL